MSAKAGWAWPSPPPRPTPPRASKPALLTPLPAPLPLDLAKLTAQGRTEPGSISFSCSEETAMAADCGSAYERKPHILPSFAMSCFRKISVTWPNLSNSLRSIASVVPTGIVPMKSFVCPCMGFTTACAAMLCCACEFRAKLTAHGREPPGSTSRSWSAATAAAAEAASWYVTKPHIRDGSSRSFLRKTSMTIPNFANSASSAPLVVPPGTEPMKSFVGPPMTEAATGAMVGLEAATAARLERAVLPLSPWLLFMELLAKLTASGRVAPGKTNCSFRAATAAAAPSGLTKVTKPHIRPASVASCFRKISATGPYLANSSCRACCVVPDGTEPTKSFVGPDWIAGVVNAEGQVTIGFGGSTVVPACARAKAKDGCVTSRPVATAAPPKPGWPPRPRRPSTEVPAAAAAAAASWTVPLPSKPRAVEPCLQSGPVAELSPAFIASSAWRAGEPRQPTNSSSRLILQSTQRTVFCSRRLPCHSCSQARKVRAARCSSARRRSWSACGASAGISPTHVTSSFTSGQQAQ
mmetsp:Transcript_27737/g.88165  ORF Transcript_27737/g.88165 Transcript_27737/m.88165 type:complete len:524 (-) Transcript_27737:838-2409(-)